MSYSGELKKHLEKIIDEMAQTPCLFAKNPKTDFTRDRKLTFSKLIRLLLSMGGNSINKELYDYFKGEGLITSSAFIQQRDKLLPETLEYLLHEFNAACKDTSDYNGYHLYAVDGTDVNIAKNPNSDSYVKNGQNEGYNQLHVNALYDLLNKTYVDAIIQPRPKLHEVKAAVDMVKRNSFSEKSVLIADRGYGSMNLMEHIHRIENLEYLIRVKNDIFTELRSMPMDEFDREISFELRNTQTNRDRKDYAEGRAKFLSSASTWDFETPCVMKLRIVRFKIAEDTYETIVTSLNKLEFPIDEIKKLYHIRWGIETSFRELKYAVGLVNFHAKKEDFIKQEIFARLIMYNFCERITLRVVIRSSKKTKWPYQANFTMGIHICTDFFRYRGKEPPDAEKLISRYILPVREGRADIHNLKPKSAVFFLYRVA